MQCSAAFATQMQTVSSESQSLKTSCANEIGAFVSSRMSCAVFPRLFRSSKEAPAFNKTKVDSNFPAMRLNIKGVAPRWWYDRYVNADGLKRCFRPKPFSNAQGIGCWRGFTRNCSLMSSSCEATQLRKAKQKLYHLRCETPSNMPVWQLKVLFGISYKNCNNLGGWLWLGGKASQTLFTMWWLNNLRSWIDSNCESFPTNGISMFGIFNSHRYYKLHPYEISVCNL